MIQDGFASLYPAAAMECWVTHAKNHMTQRSLPLRLRFAVAMRGVLGIGSSIDKLKEGELGRYKHFIEFYKNVRHLVHGGKLHRACLPEIHEGLSVWQFTSEDGLEAYVNAIVFEHRVSSQLPQYTLADLCPDKEYIVSNDSGKECFRATGAELMCLGLGGNDHGNMLAYDPGDSWHYHLRAQE
jgi:alpha-galactosidase